MCLKRLTIQKAVAVASFLVAAALAFLSLIISEEHEIAAGVCMCIAQFLTLTATIFGIDYKFNSATFHVGQKQEA